MGCLLQDTLGRLRPVLLPHLSFVLDSELFKKTNMKNSYQCNVWMACLQKVNYDIYL